MKIAVVGAGWSGMAAAVAAVQAGHHVSIFEAVRTLGGRARALDCNLPNGTTTTLDNGQHILIGAYTETLRLMRAVGLNPDALLLRQPLALPFADGTGLQTPGWAANWPAPLDALAAMATARGWSFPDRWSLLRTSLVWQWRKFQCPPDTTVAQLCQGLTSRVFNTLIEPLCISALNTPPDAASGQVFLRIMQDSLFGVRGGSHLLLPRVDLTSLFPAAAAQWLAQQTNDNPASRCTVYSGHRVQQLAWQAPHWQVDSQIFDAVIWATSATDAVHALTSHAPLMESQTIAHWVSTAQALQYEAIATVYAYAPQLRLPRPMLALHSSAQAPAQFVFDRGQLQGPRGLLAFVVSASQGSRAELEAAVLRQGATALAQWLGSQPLQIVQTVVEKRATFACTPGLVRPAQRIAPGLIAAGDYVDGPYPATLEGAVRSGLAAAVCLH
jgi:hydroxysqualene dehydroxylase